jgi:uncharacterized protein
MHGYDTKYAMHALRIGHQGIEFLTTGRIALPVAEPERGALREVRAGVVPRDDVLARIDAAAARLAEVSEDPALPAQPDAGAVDRFVVHAYRSAWDAGAYAG